MVAALAVAWRWEWLGAVFFGGSGIFFAIIVRSPWWGKAIFAAPCFVAALLFLAGWKSKKGQSGELPARESFRGEAMQLAPSKLALRWILANTVAWGIGGGLAGLLLNTQPAWVICGALVGVAQWVALRRLPLSPSWIVTTGLAWILGQWAGQVHGGLLSLPDAFWAGGIGGALAGIVQTWSLRRRSQAIALWAPLTIIGSVLGWYLGLWTVSKTYGLVQDWAYVAGGVAAGLVMGAVSAPALFRIVRGPLTEADAAPERR
jgi:hypothetical protein